MSEPVPLKEHFDAINEERRRTVTVAAFGMIATATAVIWGMSKATDVAFAAANESKVAHNGLIDRMREMARQYVTWPMVIVLLGLIASWAGLAFMIWGNR